MRIGKRMVGSNFEPIIIAEIGINHEGSLDKAIAIADSAINSGAEIIKHQTHIVEDEYSDHAKKVIPGHTKDSIYEIMKRCSLSETNEKKLMQYIKSKKRIFISTPFSKKAVDRLVKFNVPAFKIGSGECNNYPLIEYISNFNKPIILSTGMNDIKSVAISVEILKRKKIPYALLHCTNVYPTPFNEVRLNAMLELKKKFPEAVIGLSDHTINNNVSYAALGLGASIIERHFIDTKKRKGPDIACSMSPIDLKNLLQASKEIHVSLKGKKIPTKSENITMRFAFASIITTKNIKKGEKITFKNIWFKRPGTGYFLAKDYKKVIGKTAKKNIKANTHLSKIHF